MHAPIRTKQSARKATIAAQAAAMVLLLAGAAMGFVGLPGLGISQPPKGAEVQPPVGEGAAGGPRPSQQYAAAVDPQTVDELLCLIGNAPVPDPTPVVGGTDPPPGTEPPALGIRFVGTIKVGGRMAALMNIDGMTKVLRPDGPEYRGVRIVGVEGDSVVVSVDGGDPHPIERSARKGSAVSLVVGGAPAEAKPNTAVSADESPQPASFTPDMSREDRRAALLERARTERGNWRRDQGEGEGPPNR